MSTLGVAEEMADDDDDFDDQNTADGSNLDHSSDIDRATMRDDAVGCFKNHTGTMRLKQSSGPQQI